MRRAVLGVIAGLVTWGAVATLLDIGLRFALPGYRAAEPLLAFTLTMKVARLLLGAASSLAAGVVTRLVAPASKLAPWIVGGITLAVFLPGHIQIWSRLPVWYHLIFLTTLLPLVVIGAEIRGVHSIRPASTDEAAQ